MVLLTADRSHAFWPDPTSGRSAVVGQGAGVCMEGLVGHLRESRGVRSVPGLVVSASLGSGVLVWVILE